MSYLTLGFIAVILLLAGALAIAVKVAQSKSKKIKELEVSLETARNDLRRQGEYQNKREEAQQNADDKKQTLHTGNSDTDFNNSIDVLNNAGKNTGS